MKKFITALLLFSSFLMPGCKGTSESPQPTDAPQEAEPKKTVKVVAPRADNERTADFAKNALSSLPDPKDPEALKVRQRLKTAEGDKDSFKSGSAGIALSLVDISDATLKYLREGDFNAALEQSRQGLENATAVSSINGTGLEELKSNPLQSADRTGLVFKENLAHADKVWRTSLPWWGSTSSRAH